MTMRHTKILALALVLPGILFAMNARAFTPEQHAAVISLGELNGVALQCGYTADMRRMKKALVDAVPKVSQLGELFEDATRQGFLDMVQKNLPCPNLAPFHNDVDGAIATLRDTFRQSKP